MKVQPGSGRYRLTPDEKYHREAYEVDVDEAGCAYVGWGDPCPWNPTHQDFRRVTGSGWQFGWVCFNNGTYTHFAIDPSPMPGISPIVILDTGECEEVDEDP